MKRFIEAIAVVLLLWPLAIASAEGGDPRGPNGFDWLKSGKNAKEAYVEGFVWGIAYVAFETKGVLLFRNLVDKKAEEVIEALWSSTLNKDNKRTFTLEEVRLLLGSEQDFELHLLADYLVVGLPVGQIAEGLDSFYADYKNKQIHIFDAIYVVSRQIKGGPPEEIEAICQWLRANVDWAYTKSTGLTDGKGHLRKVVGYKDNEGHSQYIIWPSGSPQPRQ
jgi:hypothetical protein